MRGIPALWDAILKPIFFLWSWLLVASTAAATGLDPQDLSVVSPGDHVLHILSPTLLELVLVNAKQPDPAQVDPWNWVNDQYQFTGPAASAIKVVVNGQVFTPSRVGFKRRPLYAPFAAWDLRIGNYLYLQLTNPLHDGQSIVVTNDGSAWPATLQFSAGVDPLRFNPALHVNQEGYLPAFPKKAAVGYFLGDLGEMTIPTNQFFIRDVESGTNALQGALVSRPDTGYTYSPLPYQQVYEADFSALTRPGIYQLMVPGMGVSAQFRIDDGIAMDFARTYALGMFHQRCGYNVAMPFTRFTHAPDHTAPASVPVDDSSPYQFTWQTIASYATQVNSENPPQTAPQLTNYNAQLFPFVKTNPVTVIGGHFEAGDYNRVTFNSAQLIHTLMFTVDSLLPTNAVQFDNLGLPESGDGISDILQEAKWEADYLLQVQDSDGGFFYSVYPQYREYEIDVLPENGDPQVVWPKNTACSAAAVAALAQCASSPQFRRAYPASASNYLAAALAGWQFLTNAINQYGLSGAYQEIQHFGDDFTDLDDLSWAACELFLATGDNQFQQKLMQWFPDPTNPTTFRFGELRMYACYGNVIRDYACAARSGRLSPGSLQSAYLGKSITVITNCGQDTLNWSQHNAYGSSFSDLSKAYQSAGWYFSAAQAFDIAVASIFDPKPEYVDAVLRNLNYEAGCNPVNAPFVTGLGWKRQRNMVDQYSLNDRRSLPKDGIPISNIIGSFYYTWLYGIELTQLTYPYDGAQPPLYPYYDRWCDDWNVSTEGSTTDTARGFATAAWLASQTAPASRPWRSATATIQFASQTVAPNQPASLTLHVADTNLPTARIIWEAQGQEPAYGTSSYSFVPGAAEGPYWVEAEVQWPDGRRAFATNTVFVNSDAPALLVQPKRPAGGPFSFTLLGVPQATYVVQTSSNLKSWTPFCTNVLPSTGMTTLNDASSSAVRFYRAIRIQ